MLQITQLQFWNSLEALTLEFKKQQCYFNHNLDVFYLRKNRRLAEMQGSGTKLPALLHHPV